MTSDDEARDLRAEAEALREAVGRLRARMIALAGALPEEHLGLLEMSVAELAEVARERALLEDAASPGEEAVSARAELTRLWALLAPTEEP